eukprot:COSAG02_NODE_10922_length_1831_cov_1.566975_2_plen_45_part_00
MLIQEAKETARELRELQKRHQEELQHAQREKEALREQLRKQSIS